LRLGKVGDSSTRKEDGLVQRPDRTRDCGPARDRRLQALPEVQQGNGARRGWGPGAGGRALPAPFLCTIGVVLLLPLLAVLVQTLSGASVDPLDAPAGTKAIVFLFTSTECPISNRYAPEVRRLTETYRAGVVFRLIYPNPAETPAAIREHMAAF